MAIRKITVADIILKDGTKKNGDPWKLTTLKDTEGNYFGTFRTTSIMEQIKIGTLVSLECKAGNKPRNFDIIRIIDIDTDSTTTKGLSKTEGAEAGGKTNPSSLPSPAAAPSFDIMGNLRESVEDLRAISGGAPLQWGDVVLMQDLIAEIMREKHFEYSHGIISELENKKMRAYGKATN